jgi:hypothetical protein
MLGWIRERNAKWILWIVLGILIVPFVFWGVQDYPSLKKKKAERKGKEKHR